MPDHRAHPRVRVEHTGDTDGNFGAGAVVVDPELEPAAPHAARGVDLADGELARQAHGKPARFGEGTSETEDDGVLGRARQLGCEKQEKADTHREKGY